MNTTSNIGKKVVTGTAWMVAARWCMRGIGLVSTIILARLLTPADFGIVAISMIVVGIVEVFSETGLAQSLIRHPNPTEEHFSTVWTLQILLGLAIGCILLLIAPLGAAYFNDPRITPVIQVLSLRAFLQGFENTGIIWFRKNMDFDKDFQFLVWRKAIRFVVVVVLAFILRDYWALVFALISARLISIVISFVMHPFRPRLTLVKAKDVWSYSLWMLFVHIGLFLNNRIDEIVIGGVMGTTKVGIYNIAADIGRSPTMELVTPISRVLFSAYSKLRQSAEDFTTPFLKSFSAVATISTATGVGVSLVTEDLVHVVLGKQWIESIGPMTWIALSASLFGLSSSVNQLLSVQGSVRLASVFSWSRVILIAPVVFFAARSSDLEAVAQGRLAVLVALTIVMLPVFSWSSQIPLRKVLDCLWTPIIGAICMAAVILPIDLVLQKPDALRLLIKVSAGAVVYTSSIVFLWHVKGRPDGLEERVVTGTQASYRRLRAKR